MAVKKAPNIGISTPGQSVDVQFDFQDDLGAEDVSTVDSFVAVPAGPTISALTSSGKIAQATVNGGTAGVLYELQVTITSTGAQVFQGAADYMIGTLGGI